MIHGGGCTFADAEANLFSDPNGIQTAVLTPSGNSKITCRSQLPASSVPPPRAVRWDFTSLSAALGFDAFCGTLFGASTDYTEVVAPSGEVDLTCHITSA